MAIKPETFYWMRYTSERGTRISHGTLSHTFKKGDLFGVKEYTKAQDRLIAPAFGAKTIPVDVKVSDKLMNSSKEYKGKIPALGIEKAEPKTPSAPKTPVKETRKLVVNVGTNRTDKKIIIPANGDVGKLVAPKHERQTERKVIKINMDKVVEEAPDYTDLDDIRGDSLWDHFRNESSSIKNAAELVANRKDFDLDNIRGKNYPRVYVVYSYQTPILAYFVDGGFRGHWLGNADRYSVTTTKHMKYASEQVTINKLIPAIQLMEELTAHGVMGTSESSDADDFLTYMYQEQDRNDDLPFMMTHNKGSSDPMRRGFIMWGTYNKPEHITYHHGLHDSFVFDLPHDLSDDTVQEALIAFEDFVKQVAAKHHLPFFISPKKIAGVYLQKNIPQKEFTVHILK